MNQFNELFSSSSPLRDKFYKLFQSKAALDPRIIGNNNVINYSQIRMGSDSIYSCEQPVHVNQWINLLRDILFYHDTEEEQKQQKEKQIEEEEDEKKQQKKTEQEKKKQERELKIEAEIKTKTNNRCFKFIDGTANVGGWSLNIAMNFPNALITSLECNSVTYSLLQSNITHLKLQKQIKSLQRDCISYLNSLQSLNSNLVDILCIDPPWGDSYSKNDKRFELKLNDRPVGEYLELFTSIAFHFLLKVPLNFDADISAIDFNQFPPTDIFTFYNIFHQPCYYIWYWKKKKV